MSDYREDLAKTIRKQRAQGWGWRWDGLEDWPTEKIFAQLRQIGIDTDVQRFPEQAAAAGRFKVLQDHWVQQIPEETKEAGFWEDFPLIGIPVLWARLSPQVICADLIEERLYRVMKAEEAGTQLPAVDGMPADVAAALELARFLQAAEPAQRPARFEEVNEGRYYDYCSWLGDLVESRGPDFPDAAIQIADAMSDCRERQRFQADLAMALAIAGRRQEAIARTQASIERFPDDIWVRILGGDVFEELGDDAEAIQQWREAEVGARPR